MSRASRTWYNLRLGSQIETEYRKRGWGNSPSFFNHKQMKTKIIIGLFLLLLLFACNRTPDLLEFTYTFSMESVNNFKVTFQLNPDSTYKVGRFNYFFDNFEGKKKPKYNEGRLTTNEFKTFKKLIEGSKLNKMKNAYGFDNPTKEGGIIYIVELSQQGKSKYISINSGIHETFPEDFTKLIEYTNTFINIQKK